MIAFGLKINWWYADEYVPITFENIENLPPDIQTLEFWRAEKEFVQYNGLAKCSKKSGNEFIIEIDYKPDRNPDLIEKNAIWGKSVLSIKRDQKDGEIKWIGSVNTDYDATCKWELIQSGLFKTKEREHITRQMRRQQQLRSALISLDKKCALTGESTHATLEAAHIIPSQSLGAEVIQNAILLRSDIHRLLDANLIKIETDGRIELDDSLSSRYKEDISVRQLPNKIFERIKEALLEVEKL